MVNIAAVIVLVAIAAAVIVYDTATSIDYQIICLLLVFGPFSEHVCLYQLDGALVLFVPLALLVLKLISDLWIAHLAQDLLLGRWQIFEARAPIGRST